MALSQEKLTTLPSARPVYGGKYGAGVELTDADLDEVAQFIGCMPDPMIRLYKESPIAGWSAVQVQSFFTEQRRKGKAVSTVEFNCVEMRHKELGLPFTANDNICGD